MNILQKLQQARVKLQSEKLEKTGRNEFAGYGYFELSDFLPQTQTIFGELGLCGVVSYSLEGCSLTILNTEDPNEKLVFLSPWAEAVLKGCHPIQNLGAAETYQRRYLWVTAMEIVEHDALDATTGSNGERAMPKEEMVTTNRLVPKAYWDATDQLVKDKLLGGTGNSVKKVGKDWFICEPAKNQDTKKDQPEPPAAPPTEGYERWRGRIDKITQKSTPAGVDYWEIETTGEQGGKCFCKNAKLIEELRMMDSEEVVLLVQESTRRKGSYELMDFEGALAQEETK